MIENRDSRGRFVVGNCGGPGRQARACERDYLAALSNAVSVADWRKIVQRAKADALKGDSKAREWLTKYLLGNTCGSLSDLAIAEQAANESQPQDPPQAERRVRYKLHQ